MATASEELQWYLRLSKQAKVFCHFHPEHADDGSFIKMRDHGLQPMEATLLVTLSKKLPISPFLLETAQEDPDYFEGPLEEIPVCGWFDHGDGFQDEIESCAEALQVAAGILEEMPDFLQNKFQLKKAPALGKISSPDGIEQVISTLQKAPTPQKYLADAMAVIARRTGVYTWDGFCTCGDGGCGHGLQWDIEDINVIAREQKRALEIGKHIDALSTWIASNPPRRAQKLIDLYNSAVDRCNSQTPSSQNC